MRPSLDGEHDQMMPSKIYLRSFDKHDDVLEYELPKGASRVISRSEFDKLGVARTFGSFTQEDDHVAGVYATPEGPTFFCDGQRVARPFGQVTADVQQLAPREMRFTLSVDGRKAYEVVYRGREGMGTNPYDNDPEDVDLFALMASGTRTAQFFANYTKAWV